MKKNNLTSSLRVFLSLVALLSCGSINAQLVKIYENGTLTKTYKNTPTHTVKVVVEDVPAKVQDANLLTGKFSVSATKKVQFTKGNLWWSGSAFGLEEKQSDYKDSWDESHVSHFYWTTDAAKSYVSSYSYVMTTSADDVPFFAESTDGLTVAGTEGLYALSMSEWKYLINEDNSSDGRSQTNRFAYAKVNGTNGLLIFPDGYQEGTAVSGVTGIATVNTYYANYPESSIAAETWSTMEAAGVVFLPAAGCRMVENIGGKNDYSYYWSSTLSDAYNGYCCIFQEWSLKSYDVSSRSNGCALRLVKTAE